MYQRISHSRQAALLRRASTLLFACLLPIHNTYSDITSDGTLGTSVNLNGADYDITGGTTENTNLFHSFGIFDVNTGETATFQGPASIDRIIGRVTGGSISNIDGILRSNISGADLYLINPTGVVFGENASLDISGSFHVTTADYLIMGSDVRFDMNTTSDGVLSSSAPSAFGFVSNTPAAIEFNGSDLRVPLGETLSIIGGDITIKDTHLYAKQGRINIASVGSSGVVQPTAAGLDTTGFTQMGNINVSQSTNIFGRPRDGIFRLANIDTSGDGGGGMIYIRGGNFVSDNGSVFSDAHGSGSSSVGKIDVQVEDEVRLTNQGRITTDTISGAGGDILLTAKKVVLESGGTIASVSFGSGHAGTITINASEQVSISGRSASPADDPRFLFGNQQSQLTSETLGTGQAGVITITSDKVSLDNESFISVGTLREGDAGSLHINAGDISISGGAEIVSDSQGEGDGGVIDIHASGRLSISGTSTPGDPEDTPIESKISTNALAQGNGGSITISADQLIIENQGLIRANLIDAPSSGQASPTVDTRAGNITITANAMSLSGGGKITSGIESVGTGGNILATISGLTEISGTSADGKSSSGIYSASLGAGDSGSIQLTTGQLQMDNLSTLNTSTNGSGNAGNILVEAVSVALNSGARISSSTTDAGDGGQVTVTTTGAITASGVGSDGFGSGFYSDVQTPTNGQPADASGNGGNIDLTSSSMMLNDGATVSAKSSGTGNAGTINIDAGASLAMNNNASITTKATLAGGGKINVIAQDMIHLVDSSITSSVADGSGNGGDINIDPVFVILDGSQILAKADAGTGGNIQITAQHFIASPDSLVNASANTGIDGEVNISSPDTDLSGSLTDLPESFLNAAALLKQRCAARAGGAASSFVVAGAGGVPATPDNLLYANISAPVGVTQSNTAALAMKQASVDVKSAVILGCKG